MSKRHGHSHRMASVAEIVTYWSQHQDESGLAVDWAEAHKRCWTCGRKKWKRNFDRCHIIPRSLGGLDSADNLVLLCPRCHKQAPNVNDPSFIWFWLRSRAVPLYDTEWIISGLEEYQRLFGKRPFSGPNPPNVSELKHVFRKFREQAIIYFGEGRPNPSTFAWVIAKMEDEAGAHLASPSPGGGRSAHKVRRGGVSGAASTFTPTQSRFARLTSPLQGEVKKD
jgi:HNH endonuclease